MEEFEKESRLFTAKSFRPQQGPSSCPVHAWTQKLNPDWEESLGDTIWSCLHQDFIFKKDLVPLLGGHYGDVEGAVLLVVLDGGEELLVIVRQETRIRERVFTKNMVSVQHFM